MSWLPRIFKAPKQPIEPFDFTRNRYRAKKKWPPDFSKLSEKEQFRFEKKWRRRNKLAWARPRWNKATKLVQWGLIIGFSTYSILFYDWERKEGDPEPFEPLRRWYRQTADSIWSYSNKTLTAEDAQRIREKRLPPTP
ncbi:uncharacterized protein PV09_07421 [Verruconis gallopava]|uniref:Uncharacterized protein n=1 Tax=Verruconis gallopava TaxID=253628 RepID=A0A0D2A3W1_9PEZI|nr:uncharacterized protein PV09_07421 [Verruconis gallopava]KIW01135.1 hypothetical protein PV09_07421 [Verruconis gallopava]